MVEGHRNYPSKYLLTVVFASIFLFSFGILVHNAFADQVIATIPVGNLPMHVTTNPNTDKIYVSNQYSNNVSVIDGANNTVINTIPVAKPSDIKANPSTNMIYVASYQSYSVSVIDGKTDTVVSTISNVVRPWGLGVNPNTNLIYVAGFGNGNYVYVINGTTNTITQKIPFAYNEIPHQPAVNPKTNMIYVPTTCSYCHQSYITVIDGFTNTKVATIYAGMRPSYADVNPDTNMIYVSDDANTYQTDVINGSNNTLVATIPMTSCAAGVGVNPNTNLIYVANCSYDYTYIIDGTNNNIIGKVSVGAFPLGVAVNPNTNRIYVTNMQDNTTSVIAATTPILSLAGVTVGPASVPSLP
jgi:YVTN family beta-propeller protein